LNSAGYNFLTGYNAGAGYDMASGLGSVDATQLVNNWTTSTGTASATVNISSSPNPATSSQMISVTVSVSGASVTPTGMLTLASDNFHSSQTIGSGACSATSCVFTIPAGTLTTGTHTLTGFYSGDTNYAAKTVSATVTVSGFTLSASSATAISTPGGSTTSTITVTAVAGYTGTATLTCALTSYPSGAAYLPSCSIPGTAVTMGGTAIATVSTTAATAALDSPKLPGRDLFGAGGGALLALLVFFGIPARRRSWRAMLGILVLMAAVGTLAACGGGGSSSTTRSTSTSGTTTGSYTFTVTGTGTPSVSPSPTTTFTVTVN
jgi:hypothetical protein